MMHVYSTQIALPYPVQQVFAWHESPHALPALLPPYPPVQILLHEGIRDDAMAAFDIRIGPFRWRWEAIHEDYILGRQFRDVQVRGPFKMWIHTHRFIPVGDAACRVEDTVQCELRGGHMVNILLAPVVRLMLAGLFVQRHRALERALREAFAMQPCEI